MRLGLDHLIDPRLAEFAAESREFYARRTPRRGPSGPGELAAARAAVPTPLPSDPPAVVEATPEGVRLRVHRPAGPVRGVHLDLHGGGFFLGSPDDVQQRALAGELGVVVVGVEHRLAPEHPWPAAPDDCAAAARWVVDRFGDVPRTIGGLSAGATLAVTTLLRVPGAFARAALEFGTYDLSGTTPAGRRIADEFFLRAYAGHVPDRTLPDVSPVFADLRGLPPVLLVVGADDVLLEDNLAMAARLAAAGVDVDLRVFPASPHGFTRHATTMARVARAQVEKWLRTGPEDG
ncbi:alpha/beta hydrolase [Kineococcus rhizosphaerae]|uniref:Acetyl esterase/lipase n=1 Tax=Kineococcus rhizosphaerae TaxID=559628 RepID=A0A2T0QZL9_9ACTN|nr:alpha/beta hydrolase [Kineococcus rhizosphaerae]PRY12111.1 acetyl esterase/lipase [Kineococcus rhizosphaerae]